MLDQDDINNIYSDLLVLSAELDSIKKCINNMAMALRPSVTTVSVTKFRKNKLPRSNDPEYTDLPWPEEL